ncbi:MAG: PstS family phosphate ABC transporter substrate-binding protein [Actinomycetota bacterium]|nr:PstS family phosphate ABC transporter substrate-binding protein [Actinomycetota bacterium]
MVSRLRILAALLVAVAVAAAGCGRDDEGTSDSAGAASGEQLAGSIKVDGSSTVAPLSTAVAERFAETQPGVRVSVGTSGTGGGFERFCRDETDISDASRPIEDDEAPVCRENGIDYTEFQVAVDALTIVVNAENDWIDCITTDQLKAIWKPGSEIDNWQDVPGGDYPDVPLKLAGPGTDSGTFDYFTNEINGEEGASRTDYTPSEDDNVIVRAVEGERGAMGYFGFSYFEQNQDNLKALAVDSGEGCVEPRADTAQAGEYTPLSRPLFIYVKNTSLAKRPVREFVRFYLENAVEAAETAQLIALHDDQLAKQRAKFDKVTAA